MAILLADGMKVQKHLSTAWFLISVLVSVGFALVPMVASAQAGIQRVATCSSDSSQTCAVITNTSGQTRELSLIRGSVNVVETGILGNIVINGNTDQLAYVYGSVSSAIYSGPPWLFILDLTTSQTIAFVFAPIGYTLDTTWFSYIEDPNGNKYPFLAPGAHYLDNFCTFGSNL